VLCGAETPIITSSIKKEKNIMKKQILTILAFAGTALASQAPIEVKVPFAFTAGAASLPAGTYTIEDIGSNCVLIRGYGGGAFVMDKSGSPEIDASGKAKLLFGRTAGGYVLESIQRGAAGNAAGQR
jgi:hypothetical protein